MREQIPYLVKLGDDPDYDQVRGLSSEVREKLKRNRPATLGQATRMPGMVSLLLI